MVGTNVQKYINIKEMRGLFMALFRQLFKLGTCAKTPNNSFLIIKTTRNSEFRKIGLFHLIAMGGGNTHNKLKKVSLTAKIFIALR
jgi:hypothetical protein